jgi:hypothetical protein
MRCQTGYKSEKIRIKTFNLSLSWEAGENKINEYGKF